MEGFDAVADGLYVLPPADFTRARNQAAADARKAGDRELAARLTALRRPTQSAWAVNLLVHRHPDRADALLELGRRLRRAQAELAGPALRELSAERHRTVAELATAAREAAAEAGARLADAQLREVEQSLWAALASEEAAEAFAAGRLTAALEEGSGLPSEEPQAAAPKSARGRKPAGRAATGKAQQASADRAAAQAAEEALSAAERTERDAEKEAQRLDRAAERLAAAEQRAAERVERARAALQATEEDLAEARETAADARRDASDAADRLAEARTAAERARTQLSDLSDSPSSR
ncbi:hypothetical protein [Kitasatospora sp. NPDC051914]|uniref:hypothetical protein n=1 Tax=Kitasatospora sp. NPDC051914 TaxID=3154945 RepID=UPI0034456B06